MILKIIITESQYRKLFNNPNGVIFGDIDESRKQMTKDEFFARVPKEFRNSDDTLKYIYSEFSGMDKPITIYCEKHNKSRELSLAKNHLQGQGCKECNREKWKNEFFDKVPKEFRNPDGSLKYIYSEFSGMGKPITIYCEKHNKSRDFSQANSHLNGQGCKECDREEKEDEFIKAATSMEIHQDDKGNPKYTYSGYTGVEKPVIVICPKEGHGPFEISQAKHHLTRGQGCKECDREEREDKFIKDAQEIHKDGKGNPIYTYDNVNYVNNKTKVTITCPKDGHGDYSTQTPNSHLNGAGCPKCKESKGEKIIREYLTNVKKYTLDPPGGQKTFSGCTNDHRGMNRCRKYQYDVYVPEINTIVEYDGEQHFKDVSAWNKNCDLNCRITIDKHKNKYCEEKEIKMIRISYNEDDIIGQLKKGLESKDMLWLSDNYPKLGWNK